MASLAQSGNRPETARKQGHRRTPSARFPLDFSARFRYGPARPTGPREVDAAPDQNALEMGDSPAEIDVCDAEALDLIRPGGRLTILHEWSGDGLAFGDNSTGVD